MSCAPRLLLYLRSLLRYCPRYFLRPQASLQTILGALLLLWSGFFLAPTQAQALDQAQTQAPAQVHEQAQGQTQTQSLAQAQSQAQSQAQAQASAHATAPVPVIVDQEVSLSQWLKQVQAAADQVTYQGVFISHWPNQPISTSSIVNIYDGHQLRRRLSALDEEPMELLRQGDVQVQLLPEQHTVINLPVRQHDFPGLLLIEPGQIDDFYRLQPHEAFTRVAGIPCQVVDLIARDDSRYDFRLCVEPESHLLLKVETFGAKHQLLGQSMFTQLLLQQGVDAQAVASPYDYSQWLVLEPPFSPIDLVQEGWHFEWPAGFKVVASLRLHLGTNDEVKQLTLSDGLSSFSLFVTPLDEHELNALSPSDRVEGAVNIYGRRVGDHWVTVLGVMPLKTLQAVAESVHYSAE